MGSKPLSAVGKGDWKEESCQVETCELPWFQGAAKVAQPSRDFGQTWGLLRLPPVPLMSFAAACVVLAGQHSWT